MRVPGTTVSIALFPSYIEVRDKGLIKKKIRVKNRSFDEVLEDLELHFKYQGKILAPGLLRETLERIGLPNVRTIIIDNETEKAADSLSTTGPDHEEAMNVVAQPAESELSVSMANRSKGIEETVKHIDEPVTDDRLVNQSSSESRLESKEETGETKITVISGEDFDDIRQALLAVEGLSDSFMSPKTKKTDSKTSPTRTTRPIRIKIDGVDNISASQTSRASGPLSVVPTEMRIDDGTEARTEHGFEKITTSASIGYDDTDQSSSATIIKPLIEVKAVILGEDSVGKKSILAKGGLTSLSEKDGHAITPYEYEKVIETKNHRVQLRVWCFDDAVKAKISRAEFYRNPDILIVVYSASDRWSFESVDFWVREAISSSNKAPPVLVIGNKIDKRGAEPDDWEERPVLYDEGLEASEELAMKLGSDGQLHQVGFLEASCLTGQGIQDIFKTAAELFLRSKANN